MFIFSHVVMMWLFCYGRLFGSEKEKDGDELSTMLLTSCGKHNLGFNTSEAGIAVVNTGKMESRHKAWSACPGRISRANQVELR